jgi:hypothetical protein
MLLEQRKDERRGDPLSVLFLDSLEDLFRDRAQTVSSPWRETILRLVLTLITARRR